jgi:thiol-disulfide isomerase/thioredoxin
LKKNLASIVVIGVLFGGIGAYVGLHASASKNIKNVGQVDTLASLASAKLFAQTMTDVTGSKQDLSQWKGKPLVVNFWATWCSPCVEEIPELSNLQTQLSKKPIQILGIGIDSPTNIKEFAAKYNVTYPLYIAGLSGTELSHQLGNTAGGLPFTIIIGADGKIVKSYLGRLKMNELKRDLDTL